MALNIKNLTKTVTEKAESVSKGIQEQIPDAVKNIDTDAIAAKADAMVKNVQKELPDTMKNVDVKASIKDMASKSSQALAKFTKQEKDTDARAEEVLAETKVYTQISYKDALRVMYYIMSVDHAITPEEIEKFDEIGTDMDPLFHYYRDSLMETCRNQLVNANEDQDYYDIVHDLVGDAIKDSVIEKHHGIDCRIMYWNVLAMAYSDGNCGEEEKRLIRYIARLINIDKAISMELEGSLQTLVQIDAEETFLKESGRSYNEVQKHIEDLTKRRSVIVQGVYALLTD